MSAKTTNETLVLKRTQGEVIIDYASLRKIALMLRSVNHPVRKQLLEVLSREKEMIVTELHTQLNIDQATASQHLAVLRRAGILKTRRDGKFIYYSINSQKISDISVLINQVGSLS